MLKNILTVCFILPLVSYGEISSYVTRPISVDVKEKSIADLKEEINNIETMKAPEVYDRISERRKEITDRNLLEIYYVIMSYLRVQSNLVSEEDLRNKLNTLINRLNWLYSDHSKEKFFDKVTNLGSLLKAEFFIHLDHKKMVECLDMADNMRNYIEYSNIRNDLGSEDGSDYFNSDYFLADEIRVAREINNQMTDLENIAKGFSNNCESLSRDQLKTNIALANNFINSLRSTKIKVGDKQVNISRNARKHLQNLASSAIEKLNERNNHLMYLDDN